MSELCPIQTDLIRKKAEDFYEEVVSLRRHFHLYPELSTQEYETANFIAHKLESWGISCQRGLAQTGVVAIIEGQEPKCRCVALRSDMDALPITEKTGLSFASTKPGSMHACGHDAHMACLLGAAHILQETRSEWKGTVKLLFQPSEEDFRSGAPVMIKEGVLENPTPSHIYALHVLPEMPAGKIGYKTGAYMASTDEIYLTVIGKGGHAATPELNVDPIILSAYILTSLQQLVSRQAPPYIPTVLSFGRIIGEGRTNTIPEKVFIEGTIRTFDEKWRKQAHQHLIRCASNVAQSMGGTCEVKIESGYPFVFNHPSATEKVCQLASLLFSPEKVEELPLRMTAEDFAYYALLIPGCLFRLGTAKEGEINTHANLHTPEFTIDERALLTGVELMTALGMAG